MLKRVLAIILVALALLVAWRAWSHSRQRVTLDVRAAPLADVARAISRQTGATVEVAGTVTNLVTLELRDVPLREPLELAAEQYDGRFPAIEPLPSVPMDTNAPLPSLRSVLLEYVSNATNIFKCPDDRAGRFGREGASYEWNFIMNNKRLGELADPGIYPLGPDRMFIGRFVLDPSATPLIYDYENFHMPNATTNGARAHKNALYADGHVGKL